MYTITILADSKPIGALVRATYTCEGGVVTDDGHLPDAYKTPNNVRIAIANKPTGGRMYHAGTLYRWYGDEKNPAQVQRGSVGSTRVFWSTLLHAPGNRELFSARG